MSGREHGSRPGSGGVASSSITNADRRERLRQLALETIDLGKDPYFMKNHLGSYECKLCLTLHNNEGSYLAHTQGRRHQMNLARRAAKDSREMMAPQPLGGFVSRPEFYLTILVFPSLEQSSQNKRKVSRLEDLVTKSSKSVKMTNFPSHFILIILKLEKGLNPDTDSCPLLNRKLKHLLTRTTNIYYLLQNLMLPFPLKSQTKKLKKLLGHKFQVCTNNFCEIDS